MVLKSRLEYFNPRAPRGARHGNRQRIQYPDHFNPRAPRGARRFPVVAVLAVVLFQSTRPARGATSGKVVYYPQVCISIHAPREGRDGYVPQEEELPFISIHAPREGRDDCRGGCNTPTQLISIHAPREGRDSPPLWPSLTCVHFNPRAPRGARRDSHTAGQSCHRFQSTRPARGAT